MPERSDDQPFEQELFDVSDEEIDEWLAEWDEADRQGAEVLREALADHIGAPAPEHELATACIRLRDGLGSRQYPLDWVRQAAGLGDHDLTLSDEELLLRCVAATISPTEETGLGSEEEATIIALQHADWLGAIVTAVRSGAGSSATASDLATGIYECPEVNTETDIDAEGNSVERLAFELVSLPWTAFGLIDEERRVTSLGVWALPRGLARAWNSDFDLPPARST